MEIKWDNYYEENVPYRMTLEELYSRSLRKDSMFYRERDVLAYIRTRGELFTCLSPAATRTNMLCMTPLGMCTDGRTEKVLCKLYLNGYWNPLDENSNISGSFSYCHKISLTPKEFEGCIETFYFSDFVGMLNDGRVILLEEE